jgi:hypothetical protein
MEKKENKKKKRVRYPKGKKSSKHYVLDVHDSIISGKVNIGK